MKNEKVFLGISVFLAVSMLVFGLLKFFDPFKGWYAVQIDESGLSRSFYWLGIAGEISTGALLLGIVVSRNNLSLKMFSLGIALASAIIIVMMMTGIYVHLHKNVPADVLPLKIKPPYIPGFFLLLAITNLVILRQQKPAA